MNKRSQHVSPRGVQLGVRGGCRQEANLDEIRTFLGKHYRRQGGGDEGSR